MIWIILGAIFVVLCLLDHKGIKASRGESERQRIYREEMEKPL
jgi:hypothetical protein